MKGIFTGLTLAVFAVSANAAGVEKDLAICASVDGDLRRLECYDGIAKRLNLDGPQSQPTNVSGTGKWLVSVKKNPIDDSSTTTLILPAQSGKSKWGKPIAMVLRCQSNTTEVFINWNDYLGSEADVLTRVGSEKAVTKRWSLSTDKQSSFYPSGDISFIKKMMEANKMVAQVTPYNESPVTAVFDTTGLSNAVKPLRENCNW